MEYDRIVDKYHMKPHPEGGYYVETFRSDVIVHVETNNSDEMIERSASTAILFLLTPGNVSRLHRIKSDEVWHFYLGGSITVVEITDDGTKTTIVGPNIENGEFIQHVVKRDTWFGSYLNEGYPYALVGCTVSPGFVFEDFELASQAKLLNMYPDSKDVIEKLTVGLP